MPITFIAFIFAQWLFNLYQSLGVHISIDALYAMVSLWFRL